MAEFVRSVVLPPWASPWRPSGIIGIRMKTDGADGAAAGPQELWEALNVKYHPGDGGESFDMIYEHEVWHDEGYSGDHFLILTRRDGEDLKLGEEGRILKWAKGESPYVVGLG